MTMHYTEAQLKSLELERKEREATAAKEAAALAAKK